MLVINIIKSLKNLKGSNDKKHLQNLFIKKKSFYENK